MPEGTPMPHTEPMPLPEQCRDIANALKAEYGHPCKFRDREFMDFSKHVYVGRAGAILLQCAAALEAAQKDAQRWRDSFAAARDAVLNERGPLEGEGMSGDQTNAVLGILDDEFAACLASPSNPPGATNG